MHDGLCGGGAVWLVIVVWLGCSSSQGTGMGMGIVGMVFVVKWEGGVAESGGEDM